LLKKGEVGNELRLYVDYPDNYDAWEWQEYSRDSYVSIKDIVSCEVVDSGAKKGLQIQRKFFDSTITQKIWFYDAERRIDFETEVDWHEQHKMLKTAFPIDINTNKATFDIQYGSIERPTHFNTSWERARFETCAHKYADLSEAGYGVSLLNDCKYGYDIHDGVMQLSLLRGPTNPNPIADQGQHFFTYSICPHMDNVNNSDVLKQAYALNNPIKAIKAMGDKTLIPLSCSLVLCNQDNVLCEVIKQAEDSDGIIVRLYESKNMRKKTKITFAFPMKQVFVCDMLENELYELQTNENTVEYDMSGFEILTLKIKA
jgi:alpha-mannosidase